MCYSIENLIIITSFLLSFFSLPFQFAFLKVIGQTRQDERCSEIEQIFGEELVWTINMCIMFFYAVDLWFENSYGKRETGVRISNFFTDRIEYT
jgi:hypothetical protein